MRRSRTARAEIGWRGDDAAAKVILPNAIHHDSGGERMRRRGNPFSERFAAIGRDSIGRRLGDVAATERREKAGANFHAETGLAAQRHVGIGGYAVEIHDARRDWTGRMVGVEADELAAQGIEARAVVGGEIGIDFGLTDLDEIVV